MTTPELKPCEMPVYDFESNWDTPFSKANERVQLVKKSDADAALATARAEVESAHLARELTLAAEIDRLKDEVERRSRTGYCIHCGDNVDDGNLDHWRTCAKHPANAEVGRLTVVCDVRGNLLKDRDAEIARLNGAMTGAVEDATKDYAEQVEQNAALHAEIDRLNEMLQGFGGKCPTCLGERVIEFVAKGDGSVEFESEFEMGPCPACGGTGSGLFAEQTAEIARLKGEINVAFFACYGCGKLTDNWSEARDGRKYCEPCWHKMADAKGGTHAVIVDGERGEPT